MKCRLLGIATVFVSLLVRVHSMTPLSSNHDSNNLVMSLQQRKTMNETTHDAWSFNRFDSTSISECQKCDRYGQCDHAFRNGPGQFCGHWIALQTPMPCCCPLDAQCRVSNYACRCHMLRRHVRNHEGASNSWVYISCILLGILVCLCCVVAQQSTSRDREYVPIAQPMVATNPPQYPPQYGSYPAASGQTTYYPQPVYVEPTCAGSSSTLNTVAGAATGLAVGALLGSAFTGAGHSSQSPGVSFTGDEGGDYDEGGDFGGDF